MSDALTKVKTDLGRDAVILHTRTVKRGGLLGIGARSMVEITATADPRPAAIRAVKTAKASMATQDSVGNKGLTPNCGTGVCGTGVSPVVHPHNCGTGVSPVVHPHNCGTGVSPVVHPHNCGTGVSPVDHHGRGARATDPVIRVEDRPAHKDEVLTPTVALVNSDPVLRTEVMEIRTMVKDLLHQTEQKRSTQVPAGLLDHYTQLVAQDVAEELAVQLVDDVTDKLQERGAAHWDEHGRPVSSRPQSPEWIREELQKAVVKTLPPAQPLALADTGRPTVVALVGPTGVGKTTTIAKLAANMKLREGRRVGLITIDTFRIAAVEQLKTYAEILQVPLVAVTTPEEMRPAARQMSDADLILIDTAGRSQKDEVRIADLSRFLSAIEPDQVHLVLSSTSREEAIREAVRSFSVLGAEHVIFTKLDEAVGFGVILNVLRSVDMSLSYLTNGQSVPADIEAGSARRVAELVLGFDRESVLDRPEPAPTLESVAHEGGE